MSRKFRNYKQTLIKFFENQGYLVYGKTATKKITYLYSKTAPISVIKLALVKSQPEGKLDQELEYLKQEVAQQKEVGLATIDSLEVYFSENFENNFAKNNNSIIIITHSWDYLTHSLALDFPKLANIEDPEVSPTANEAKMAEDDFNLEDITSPEDLKKRLNALNSQLKNGTAISTMIIAILFLITPFVLAIASAFVVKPNQGPVRALVFGGSTYTLTILGGQWWRIFTYGFGAGGDLSVLILMVILIWMGFRLLRLNELMIGTWKMLGTFLIAYLLTGFFLSILGQGVVSGSDGIAFAIIVGMMALNVGGSTTALSTVAKSELIWPIVWLIIYALFASSTPAILIGFIAGGSISFMFTYDYKELNWRLGVGIVIILALILVPVALLLVPTYVPGVDPNVINGLRSYVNLNFMSVDRANSIINKIGWDNVDISKEGSWIWTTFR